MTTTTRERRWNRVAATITADAGLTVGVDSKTSAGTVSYSITHRLPSGDVICVIDQWWRKNHDVWIGYAVWIEGRDSIVRRQWPVTKKHTEVATAVREALTLT